MPIVIAKEDVQQRVAAGAQLVEVLPAEEYAREHLPGAISLPLKELTTDAAGRLARDRPVIVYCFDGQ